MFFCFFQYLKTNSKLPLIEENAEATGLGSGWSGASSEVVSSGSTLRQMNSPKRHANAQQRPLSLPPKPQIKFLRKTKSLSTPNGSKQGKSMIFFCLLLRRGSLQCTCVLLEALLAFCFENCSDLQ